MAVPPPYNLTAAFGNSTCIVGLMQGVNSVLMHGYYGIVILIAIFAISFMSFIRTTNDPGRSFTATSFLLFIFSIMLRALNLIPDIAVYISLGMLGIGVAVGLKTR